MKKLAVFLFAGLLPLASYSHGTADSDCAGETSTVHHGHGSSEIASARTITTRVTVLGMSCHRCVNKVTAALRAVPGVEDVSVVLETGVATVTHGSGVTVAEIRRAIIEDAGFDVKRDN